MGVHIQPQVSDFTVYFYDSDEHRDDAALFDDRAKYRAVMSGAIKTGVDHGIKLHGLCGSLEPGDTDDLAIKLKLQGYQQVWAEVHKDIKVSRFLTLVDELEHTNIYYCDLRELPGGKTSS